MLDSMKMLRNGNDKQLAAFRAIQDLNILVELNKYSPVICGTIPLGVDTDESDIDVIMEVHDLQTFMGEISQLYDDFEGFRVKETVIRNNPVVKANFHYAEFEFELFAQSQPVKEQHAYIHLVMEYELLSKYPGIKEKIINLKQQGIKTEPAFCQVLGIEGSDPYTDLISAGQALLHYLKKDRIRQLKILNVVVATGVTPESLVPTLRSRELH
ncbi:DUF4269 domain-containing protein [Ornithinibacillus scapharcae]|uniref:DUF4269 domain-containing protein n=1 Tax=Ornithinibacillus scapharcae TaxID=1147159 RepID=UPI000225ADD9|nr:DUF4269 domain-containing protein [Ornithinibacillus scapharcae]